VAVSRMPDLRLYDYSASCNCLKVRILLGQLGLAYERVEVDIFDGDTLTDAFRAINPARSTPVLETAAGRYLQESNAILWYLADGSEYLPRDAYDRAQVLRWLIIEQTDVVPAIGGLRFRLATGRLRADDPDALRRRTLGEELLGLLDEHLGGRSFVVGESYSIADLALYGYTHVAGDAGYELERFPAVAAWLRRVEERPRFVNDLEPYPENARPGRGRSLYG
jgi:glutathione S-transferase